MKILVLGADGYLGWPTVMNLAEEGYEVIAIDNYLKRNITSSLNVKPLFEVPEMDTRCLNFYKSTNKKIFFEKGDCTDHNFLNYIFKKYSPDTVIHYAEQPSAPFSMIDFEKSNLTLQNNINSTFNLIWSVLKYRKDCHIIKLGTMGEYGTPDIDIEEGWIKINHNGRSDQFLYPRQASSLYHTSKILDTDLLWFYVRTYGLKVTDLMQGPVYGIFTNKLSYKDNKFLTSFYYDDIFGTVLNRFLVQAVAEKPLTVYGDGGQTRGYLNIKDTLQCINIAIKNPPSDGGMEIMNQFTEQFTVIELAEKVKKISHKLGLNVKINKIENPRKEKENHYYNAAHSKFKKLGLTPNFLTDKDLEEMIVFINQYKDNINVKKILPSVSWKN